MSEKKNPWTTLSNQVIYNNPWIKIVENKVLNPSGNDGIYGVVHFKRIAVAIIPLDKDLNTWIVGQYRYPTNTYEWEVPEGGCEINEQPLETAKRELVEEVGVKAEEFTLIQEMQLSNSTTDEVSCTYIAQDLTQVDAQPDEDEQIEIKKLPFEELYQMAINGEIKDALSIAGIFKTKYMLDNKLITF